jgi:energy-coupling factor transport system ATP-binding protein
MTPIIVIQNVTFTYAAASIPALRAVTLEVPAGQILGVAGRAGAGKSTLCALCAGFVPNFYQGEIRGAATVDGHDVIQQPVATLVRHVSLVSSNPFSQISGARTTVFEEIGFGLENLGVARGEMHERITWALQAMQIEHLADRSPYALSGGQQQRMVIAAALAMRPPVLVLDEPTAQLDLPATVELAELLLSLSRQGTTILVAEHNLEWLAELAQRVVVLDAGHIIADGPPQETLADPLLLERGVGWPRPALFAARAREHGQWPAGRPLPVTLAGFLEGMRPNAEGRTLNAEPNAERTTLNAEQAAAEVPPHNVSTTNIRAQPFSVQRSAFSVPEGVQRSAFSVPDGVQPSAFSLSVEDVHFTYPSGVAALKGVSLTFGAGERVALLGRNGAGKSTLLRHLNGLLRPTSGRVIVAGADIRAVSVARTARRVGLVFQDVRNQLFARTVREELRFGPRNLGLPAAQVEAQVEAAMAALGLTDAADEHPYDLPPPRRRLVAVAAVLAMDTDMLVLDEPTAGLDTAGVALLARLTADLAARGKTVVVVSHDLDFCFENLERIVLLRDGLLVLDAPRDGLTAEQVTQLDETVGLPLAIQASRELGVPVGV